MDKDPVMEAVPDSPADPVAPLRERDAWVPLFSVVAVAVAALAAVLLPARWKNQDERVPASVVAAAPAVGGETALPATGVVKAPPLATHTMGNAAACANCGVVENVIAVHGQAQGEMRAVGFLMNIRMDDGSSRTVEHRGALAAGSRVIVEGESVRAMPRGI